MKNLKCQHLVIRTSSISSAKEFYVEKLGLEIFEETECFLNLKAGDVYISFFEGYKPSKTGQDTKAGISFILKIDNIETAMKKMSNKGLELNSEIIDIPNFYKLLELKDYDGNSVFLGEYTVEPEAVV